jgi:hypothetical protein
MYNFGTVMRHLQIREAAVELKSVAAATVCGELNGSHNGLGPSPGVACAVDCRRRDCLIRPRLIQARQTVAVVAGHLHSSILGTHKVWLKMKIVVEPDLSGIYSVIEHGPKLRVAFAEC